MAARTGVAGGLVRPRLLARLADPADVTLVVAPAGSGKTTLLAQYAHAAGDVGRHRLGPGDTDPARLAARLDADPAPALVLDDFDVAIGTPAEAAVERLLAAARRPVLVASRRLPAFNLSRAELGTVAVVTADDLRFRSWEVERLFGDVYGEPLPPADAATLTRRTEGWAAGLHLFHLSTCGRPLSERRRAIESLSGRSHFARAYLARTVLDDLPAELRDFLRLTCVFEVVTAGRCDRLLGTNDAASRLADLERRQALTTTDDGGRTYRYHEVLRRHLEAALVDSLGEAGARDWYATAAGLLEDDGAWSDAAAAYLRAERWPDVARLLRADGALVIGEPADDWPERLPARLVDDDPWLSLAVARRTAADGRLAAAAERYRHAESLFAEPGGRRLAGAERRLVDVWNGAPARPELHWSDRLCAALRGHPLAVAAGGDRPEDVLASAAALLLAGQPADAAALLRERAPVPDGETAALAARLLAAVTAAAGGTTPTESAESVGADAERAGAPWLARLCHAFAALAPGAGGRPDPALARRVATAAAGAGDEWGTLLAHATAALAAQLGGGPAGWPDVAARARRLGAATVEAWALAFGALAGECDPRRAESFARATGGPGARAVAAAVVTRAPAPRPAPPRAVVTTAEPPMTVRCLGEFAFEVAGRALDWRSLRPRAATALRLLAVHAGLPVHRETLLAALWPDVDVGHATHNLQVAVSSLRAFTGQPRAIARQGDAYALVVPAGGRADVVTFRDALHDAQQARAGRRPGELRAALRAAVAAYGGDLLPGDGPAEWVAAERERLRAQAAAAAAELARLELADGGHDEAIAAAGRSLEIDRFLDASWRVLIDAFTRAGDRAAAERARRGYAEVLDDLGVPAPVSRR